MAKRGGHGHSTPRIHWLDDACLVRILSYLTPMPDRFNAARVCKRWQTLVSDSRMWLHVDSDHDARMPMNVFSSLQDAVLAARPGDTLLIAPGVMHECLNVHINKPLCLVGGGTSADETVLFCPRGFESALEFSASGRVANLTIKAELGSCLLHRKGRLTVDNCFLECADHPLDHLSCPIISTADDSPCPISKAQNEVSVIETRIEGGFGCVRTSGSLKLQQVRVMFGRAALTFWFQVSKHLVDVDAALVPCQA
ncbi:unnamed protein product [Sphagnum balticum]